MGSTGFGLRLWRWGEPSGAAALAECRGSALTGGRRVCRLSEVGSDLPVTWSRPHVPLTGPRGVACISVSPQLGSPTPSRHAPGPAGSGCSRPARVGLAVGNL